MGQAFCGLPVFVSSAREKAARKEVRGQARHSIASVDLTAAHSGAQGQPTQAVKPGDVVVAELPLARVKSPPA